MTCYRAFAKAEMQFCRWLRINSWRPCVHAAVTSQWRMPSLHPATQIFTWVFNNLQRRLIPRDSISGACPARASADRTRSTSRLAWSIVPPINPASSVAPGDSRSHVTGLMSTPRRQFSPSQGIRRNRTAFANWVPTSAALPRLPLMKSINGPVRMMWRTRH